MLYPMSRTDPASALRRRVRRAAAIGIAALLAASGATAVVIDTGDGTGNTAAPVDDFGFERVGVTDNGLSGIYLGASWVLTANHVHDRQITFLGQTYDPLPGTGVRLNNVSGVRPDLFVYRINGYPPLPPIVLASTGPALGEEVRCTGNGWNREASSTTWNVNWEESTPPPNYTGFKRAAGHARRWGRNEASGVDQDVDILNGSGVTVSTTHSFEVAFDDSGGVPDEFQAVSGDSGGGCFAKRSGTWELVGVMFAMGTYGDPNGSTIPPPAQPADTAVYGNISFVGDVAFYRDQIEALTPTPVPGLLGPAAGALVAGIALAAGRSIRRRRSRQ
jgi:hypothetical protein